MFLNLTVEENTDPEEETKHPEDSSPKDEQEKEEKEETMGGDPEESWFVWPVCTLIDCFYD